MTKGLWQKAEIIADFIYNNQSLDFKHNCLTGDKSLIACATTIDLENENDYDKIIFKVKDFLSDTNFYSFEQLPKGLTKESLNKPFFIFEKTSNDFALVKEESIDFTPHVNTTFKKKIEACISYFKILSSIQNNQFCDHHNEANKEIIFYSNTNGILKLNYELEPLIEDVNYNNSEFDKFEEYSESKTYKSFLINSLYHFIKNDDHVLTIKELLYNLESINKRAYRNQEIASKQFDFEKFKKQLYKEKEKYFTSIREIINKIFTQIIGVPISISASVLATFKVNGDCILFLMILFAYVLYTTYYLIIQYSYYSDLKEVKSDFERDFLIIVSESGIEEATIDIEKKKINRKLNSSLKLTISLIWIVMGLDILVLIFLSKQALECELIKLITSFWS